MKYFSIEELTRTGTGLPNVPADTVIHNLTLLVEHLLDPVREAWGNPVRVNSGYRSSAVNAAVGGAKNSAHLYGYAADITVGDPAGNQRLFRQIIDAGLEFDQLIDERNYTWLHVSYKPDGNRKQVLHLK
jgi:hypothetical protein